MENYGSIDLQLNIKNPEKPALQKTYLSYIHNFRGLAILIIIAYHCLSEVSWGKNRQVGDFLNDLLSNGSVYFVFISGFLFQHLIFKYRFKNYLIKKFKNVLMPYFFMSIPAIFYIVFIKGMHSIPFASAIWNKSILYQIAWLYCTGMALVPYWFIPMISIFYLISPILILIDRNEKLYYMMPVLFIVSSMVHRPEHNLGIIHSLTYFFSIYLFGMWARKFQKSLLSQIGKYSHLLIIIVLMILPINFFTQNMHGNIHSQKMFSSENGLIDFQLFGKLAWCLLLIYYFNKYDYVIQKIKFDLLAEMSFGLYFIHAYFLSIFSKYLQPIPIFKFDSIFEYFFIVAATCSISMGFLWLMKKLFGYKSKYITGY